MKNFALIGAAGFIAERHMRAIKETGNQITAATDQFDVMGRMDSFFPEAEFFLDFQKFEEYLSEHQFDFTSVCSPNYLHAAHIQSALHAGTDAICEKPLVLFPDELEAVEKAMEQSGKQVFNILQLRLHETIIALREKIKSGPKDKIYDIDLTYITSRGKWYYESWKGDKNRSGGVATNIGIHFFDMLSWIFGEVENSIVHAYDDNKAAGFLQLKQARVRWYLSLDYNDIPTNVKLKGMRTYRSILVEGDEIEFSEGFTNLHTISYQHILNGKGFRAEVAKPCIILTHQIRNAKPIGLKGDYHPLLKESIS
ncbi:Gfo/Idh/MocA family oxidoreductase [Mangrovibacterium sp.]|uniref:Gfo/Idh/MocA family oxidoreductase n=1 Tax=Mangrovibacterium sp. TaxID=1961364 RepID=UPI003568652A